MAPMATDTTVTPAPTARLSRRARAQLGNLNGTRRPWAVFWKRRALRPEDRWVLPLLERYGAGLVDDKGGPDNMSAAELRMVELAQLARACSLLVLSTAANEGGLTAARRVRTSPLPWPGSSTSSGRPSSRSAWSAAPDRFRRCAS